MVFDQFGDDFALQYKLYQAALMGSYAQQIKPAGSGVAALTKAALEHRQTFLKTAVQSIKTYVTSLGSNEHQDNANRFFAQVSTVSMQSVIQLVDLAKQSKLNAFEVMHGGMGELLNKKFTQPDTSIKFNGKSYEASQFIRGAARQFAYMTALEEKIGEIQKTTDLAEIIYSDPTHKNNGLVISITGKAGYPSLAQTADELFHYNATAWLRAHVQS